MRSPRQWFYDLMSKGEPPRVDDDEIVEAGVVGLTEGPLVMGRIHEAGIHAESAETRVNPYSATSRVRILCRAADLPQVVPIIQDVTGV